MFNEYDLVCLKTNKDKIGFIKEYKPIISELETYTYETSVHGRFSLTPAYLVMFMDNSENIVTSKDLELIATAKPLTN